MGLIPFQRKDLPLDKLQQIVSQPASSTPDLLSQPLASTTPTPAPVDLRSRDALRSRDREDRP